MYRPKSDYDISRPQIWITAKIQSRWKSVLVDHHQSITFPARMALWFFKFVLLEYRSVSSFHIHLDECEKKNFKLILVDGGLVVQTTQIKRDDWSNHKTITRNYSREYPTEYLKGFYFSEISRESQVLKEFIQTLFYRFSPKKHI